MVVQVPNPAVFKELYTSVELTYGYITKNTRIANNLSKTTTTDARCISGNPLVLPAERVYVYKALRRHNRSTHKQQFSKGGKRIEQRVLKSVKGFCLHDKVRVLNGLDGFINKLRRRGSFTISDKSGKTIADVTLRKLQLLEHFNGFRIA